MAMMTDAGLTGMNEKIDYHIEKYHFAPLDEAPRLAHQWSEVLNECRETQAGAEERLRIALLNVDYVTSFELPSGYCWCGAAADRRNTGGAAQPEECGVQRQAFRLRLQPEKRFERRAGGLSVQPVDPHSPPGGIGRDALPYREIAKALKAPRERLRLALEQGLPVTALDGLFWFGIQRIAAEVRRLRKTGMAIVTAETEISTP